MTTNIDHVTFRVITFKMYNATFWVIQFGSSAVVFGGN